MRLVWMLLICIPWTSSNTIAQVQPTSKNTLPIRYDLNVRVLPDAHLLEVNGTMKIPASNASRAFVQLVLSELMSGLQVEVLQPKASAGPARLENTKVERREAFWSVYPLQPFPSGEPILLRFSYSGGGKIAPLFYIGPEVSFASGYGTNWYPLVNNPSDVGIGSLRISVPAGETVIAGEHKHSSPKQEAQGTFVFETSHANYFSFAAGKYKTFRRNGAIPISAYLLSDREHMMKYLEDVAKIFDVLVREFGPYRFKEFALAEIPRDLAKEAGFNAASLQGFAYVNSNAFKVTSQVSYMFEWYGHEFSHQWWPHTVALKRPGGWATEEMLAEYGGSRVVETIAGPAMAELHRRKGYPADPIYSALEYFKLVAEGVDYELADLPREIKAHNIGYNKGFLVWGMLSREIGREKFQRILRQITRRHAFQHVTIRELWRAIERGAGRNLHWFFQQWFERRGAPEYQLTWKQEGHRVSGSITQAAPYYRATMEVEVEGTEGQRSIHKIKVSGARTEFVLPVKFRVHSTTLDPHYLVLRWTPEYHTAAEAARSGKATSK
jgi:peptidase M1-like protein